MCYLLLVMVAIILLGYYWYALHGICCNFFFVSGQIYTDSKRERNLKTQHKDASLGHLWRRYVGRFLGGGKIVDANALAESSHDWLAIWKFTIFMQRY